MPAELHRLAPDLVHLHFPNPMGELAYLLSRCHAPVVMTYHADIIGKGLVPWVYRPLFKLLDRRIRRIIVSTRDYLFSSSFISRYGDKSVVIPYGIDIGAFSLRDGEAKYLERLRQHHGHRLVLFLGVLRSYKGLPILLHAMKTVAGRLLIVGRGSRRATLERLSRQLGVASRVRFLGEVSESQRRLLLHASDVLVLPSIDRREAFGIAQLEAMVCGKPIVASDLPTGVRVVNRHGVTGLLVPPGDPDALAHALNLLLDDGELRTSLGKAGHERVELEFGAERMIARTLGVYDEVVTGSGRHRIPA